MCNPVSLLYRAVFGNTDVLNESQSKESRNDAEKTDWKIQAYVAKIGFATLVGAAVGGTIGFFVGGPVGLVLGIFLGAGLGYGSGVIGEAYHDEWKENRENTQNFVQSIQKQYYSKQD